MGYSRERQSGDMSDDLLVRISRRSRRLSQIKVISICQTYNINNIFISCVPDF
jgi:hypothetical protein